VIAFGDLSGMFSGAGAVCPLAAGPRQRTLL